MCVDDETTAQRVTKRRTEFENGRTDILNNKRKGGSGTSWTNVKVTCEEKPILESREVTTESLSVAMKLSIGSVHKLSVNATAGCLLIYSFKTDTKT